MIKQPLNSDKQLTLNGNKISYRNLASYHMKFHCHDAMQILIPLDNANFEISWETEDKDVESKSLGAGDICIIPSLLKHEVRWINCAHFVSFYISQDYICETVGQTYDKESKLMSVQIGIRNQFIFQLGLAIKQMILLNDTNDHKYFEATMVVITNYLLNNFLLKSPNDLEINDHKQLPCGKIRDAVLFMSNNISRNLSIHEISEEIEMSQYHFIRLFKENIGMPPSKFHMLQRIEKAKVLLSKQNKIIDVTYQLGFSSQSHFSNVFTKSVGITPLKFQQRH